MPKASPAKKVKKIKRRASIRWEARRYRKISSVLILESQTPAEWYDECREGPILAGILRLLGIDAVVRMCLDREQFTRAIETEAINFDVLHISCHGDENGICLTDGSPLTWQDLSQMAGGPLHGKVLVLSSCMSGKPTLAHLFESESRRPGIIIGTLENIDWDKAALAWQLMYKFLKDGKDILQSLRITQEVLQTKLIYKRWKKDRYVQPKW